MLGETATSTETSARHRLRAAIAKRNSRREAAASAEATLARAETLVREAEAKLRAFGDVDGEIAAHRACRLRAALDAGAEVAVEEAPPELRHKLSARDEARRHVSDLGAMRAQIGGELEAAKKALASSERAVVGAAAAVLTEHAADLAGEVYRRRRELVAAYDALVALSGVWVGGDIPDGRMAPLTLPAGAKAQLELAGLMCSDERGRRFYEPAPALPAPTGQQFHAALAALAEDADAPLPEIAR